MALTDDNGDFFFPKSFSIRVILLGNLRVFFFSYLVSSVLVNPKHGSTSLLPKVFPVQCGHTMHSSPSPKKCLETKKEKLLVVLHR